MAVISNQHLLSLATKIADVPGDFIEVGVFKGHTFKRLALLAHILERKAHAFDSFEGMAPPTEKDCGYYPQGQLNVGGLNAFKSIMQSAEVPTNSYVLHQGWVPDCFIGFEEKISFALVDVDQYQPTVQSLDWVWPRLEVGGILVLDDYFRNREGLASLAIDEWLSKQDPFEVRILDYINTQLYIQKYFTAPNLLPKTKG